MASSLDSSEPVIQLNNLYDEIHVIEEELKNNSNSNKMINLIKSNKLKKLFIKVNDYVELKIILQFEYPKVSPNLIQILYSKVDSLDYESEKFLDSFFKRTNLALNTTIDRNHGKCCVYKIYKEFKEILSQNQDILIHLNEIIESNSINDGKDEIFDNLIYKKIFEKKNQDKNQKKSKIENEDESEKGGKFKGSDIIFQRLKWDESIDKKDVIIGYLDRFKGVMEIKFNDFKGVHDDYKDGIPLHRIRYYKICGKIVWDREKKIDLLTGSNLKEFYESNNKSKILIENVDIKKDQISSNMVTEGPILKYNSSNSTWSEHNTSETVSNCNNEIKVVTYNVLSTSNFKHSIRYANDHGARGIDNIVNLNRNDKIIECIINSNADIIALQECDLDTEKDLKNNKFIQERYLICSTNHINNEINCLILTKFIPSSYSLLKLTENSPKCALIIKFKAILNSAKQANDVYFANIHLTSDKSTNSTLKRRKQLESLTNHIIDLSDITQNSICFICGDFNTSNDIAEDQEIINRFLINNQFVDLAPNSNTFDPNVNFTAAITSSSNKPRRYDRLYIRVANKIEFLVKSAQLLNTKPLEYDKNSDFYYEPYAAITSYNKENIISLNENNNINFSDVKKSKLYLQPSDHYALLISIGFKNLIEASNLSHKAALAIVLPKHASKVVQNIRKKYDRTFNRWPPHINLLYPFFESMNTETISKDLSHVLSKYEPFTMDFNKLNHFVKNCVVYMEPNKQEAKNICEIQAEVRNFFSELADSEKFKPSFTPHMTISQPENKRDTEKNWSESMLNKITSEYGPAESCEAKLPVDALYWLTRNNENEPFVVQHIFPIGKYLPPIHIGIEIPSGNSKSGVIGFLNNNNLIDCLTNGLDCNSKLLISSISSILKGFDSNGYNYGTPNTLEIYPIGSYCFGTKYSDIDMIVLKQKPKPEFKNNTPTHEEYVKDLAKSIAFYQDDFYIARVINDAYVPIIEITLNENSKTYKTLIENGIHMIDIQIYEIPNDSRFILSNNYFGNSFNYMKAISNDYTSISRLSAIFENDNLKHLIKYYKDFQILLSFVKYWAESKYIYGKAFGYIGGISYAIICIYFLKEVENEFKHVLEIDNSNLRFFKLIIRFFKFYSSFNWHESYISLIDITQVERETKDFHDFRQKTAISVLQSVYPYENLTRNVKENGKKAIKDEFKKANRIIEEWEMKHKNDLYLSEETMFDFCEKICQKFELKEDDFIYYIKFQVYYNKNNDIHHIFSIMKSKTQGLVGNLERILEKKHFIRVLPELESIIDGKIDNINYNKLGEYTIGIKYDRFDNLIEQEIQNLCQKFCTTVTSMCYTSEFEMKIIKKLTE
jgi:poly(A) polymerase